ncbi:MAG: hypothetical protein JNM34_01875 [Chthonomonadaceae bacterium]|nr:hypothetical protein [Chthonomonadaceae bacterium]
MPIYELQNHKIEPVRQTTFGKSGVRELHDLQRLIRDQIEIVGDNLLVVSEEFSSWPEAKRRIDLLAVDSDGSLVVIELKRTEDGGNMDLQAIRYAAMVSAMKFEQVVASFQEYLDKRNLPRDALQTLEDHLVDGVRGTFGSRVRIELVSADFSKELTTSVLWLNQSGLDIRCTRLRPYELDGRVLLDVQTIIPIPEAREYQLQLNEKTRQQPSTGGSGKDYTRYDVVVDGVTIESNLNKRNAARIAFTNLILRGASREDLAAALGRPRLALTVVGELSGMALEEALKSQYSEEEVRRTFSRDDEVVRYGGETFALTNQWGGDIERQVRSASLAVGITGIECRPINSK